MNDAFVNYVFSGLSLRAYAARFEIDVATVLRTITGLCVPPPELADPAAVREVLRPIRSDFLYVAMKGPRGSVRWHQWLVGCDVGHSILNDEDSYREAQESPGGLFMFSTADNLVVAINPRHMVTAIFGNEDTRFFVEQRALVPSLLVSGHQYGQENQTAVLQEIHDALKHAAEAQSSEFTVDELPGYTDKRPSLVYLRDLKNPFEDHLWQARGARDLLDSPTICSQLGAAIHMDDALKLPLSASLVDQDQMRMQVLLARDQTSVLQASRWTIERTALENTRRLAARLAGEGNDLSQEDLQQFRTDARELGLFGLDELEGYLAEFKVSTPAPAPAKKKRGRKSAAQAKAEREAVLRETVDEVLAASDK